MNMKKTMAFILAAAAVIGLVPAAGCAQKEQGLCSYDIAATYSAEDGTLSATMTFSYVNTTADEVDSLEFNLWGNAFREGAKYSPIALSRASEAYYDGISYGAMTVNGVEGCESWSIGGEDENLLCVQFAEGIYPDERATVTIDYTLSLAKVDARTGITQGGTVNLGNFYPILCARDEGGYIEAPYYSTGDPFVSDCADYTLSLTLPKGYTAATSGRQISASAEGQNVTFTYALESARDFAAVLSDEFKTSTVQADDCVLTVYYVGDNEPEGLAECAAESLKFFEEKFGKYAYPTLSVVLTPLMAGGMEYPALVMVDTEGEKQDREYAAVHEIAHQWWYAMVGSDQVDEAWQDEGLTEYSTLCFFEAHPAYGFTRAAMLGNATKAYRAYYTVYNQIFGKSDTTMSRSLGDFESEYEYANIAYNKGLIMFETVRKAMGDDKFFTALKKYFEDNKFAIATPAHLIACLDGEYDVEGIMYGFLEGKTVI